MAWWNSVNASSGVWYPIEKCILNRSTFYQGIKPSAPTDRAIRRLLLTDAVGKIHGDSRGTYGYRRVTATLRTVSGLIVNHKLVASIMQ